MKRSFVQKEIFEMLEAAYSHPEGNTNLAEAILLHLETLGMAPPEVTEPVETFVMVATPNGYQQVKTSDSKCYVRKWEDET